MLKLTKIFTITLFVTLSGHSMASPAEKGMKFHEIKKELWVHGVSGAHDILEEVLYLESDSQITEAYPEELLHALDIYNEA